MKQINKAVQALESDIGFWRPSWILLKKLKNTEKKKSEQGCIAILLNFDHSQNEQNWNIRLILKRKKIKVFIIGITPKTNQYMCRVRSFFQTKHKTNPGSGSSSRERHRILAAILDFTEEAEKR